MFVIYSVPSGREGSFVKDIFRGIVDTEWSIIASMDVEKISLEKSNRATYTILSFLDR